MAILRGSKTIRFADTRARSKPALAMVYDLGGFSAFANRPDAAQWIVRFLNHVSRAIQTVIYGGNPYWLADEDAAYDRLRKPQHRKFLGDGALYIWTGSEADPISTVFMTELCARLRDLRASFPAVLRAVREKIQIPEMPHELRFGLAVGDVYELSRTDARQREFVGVCINLASRLQKYCDGVGFLAARVQMSPSERLEREFKRVIAINVAGFPKEYVLLDQGEYDLLPLKVRTEYFEGIK